jgi:NADPH:quinone reductase-like Zn-dependent oxidoreductase
LTLPSLPSSAIPVTWSAALDGAPTVGSAFVSWRHVLGRIYAHASAHRPRPGASRLILREVAALADAGKLRSLLHKQRFSSADIDAAHALVESGALGKVVVDL